jgi:hypothetical protein
MCRNITPLRGLEPAATEQEIVAAARQYVRKITGVTTPAGEAQPAFVAAVAAIAAASTEVLLALPPRKSPPLVEPPLRRMAKGPASVRTNSR